MSPKLKEKEGLKVRKILLKRTGRGRERNMKGSKEDIGKLSKIKNIIGF